MVTMKNKKGPLTHQQLELKETPIRFTSSVDSHLLSHR